jgi:hypothetical protein
MFNILYNFVLAIQNASIVLLTFVCPDSCYSGNTERISVHTFLLRYAGIGQQFNTDYNGIYYPTVYEIGGSLGGEDVMSMLELVKPCGLVCRQSTPKTNIDN